MQTFYYTIGVDEMKPYIPNVPILLPASSYARRGLKRPKIPTHITQTAADSGGFVATFKWGDYRYTPEQYTEWLYTWKPQWSAMMDYCCEDESLSGRFGIVRERQQKTTDMAWQLWSKYHDCSWAWVPTIQGWNVQDYQKHAHEMKPLIKVMQNYYKNNNHFRVGIGTLHKRAPMEMIVKIVDVIVAELGNVPLHLWGVKLKVLQSEAVLPKQVVSMDSAAFGVSWKRSKDEIHSWTSIHKKTKRHFLYEVALPRYQSKIEAALSRHRKLQM